MEAIEKNNSEQNSAITLTGLNRQLCRVAGSDLDILARCPHEISRHARIGAIIISTAVLASVSMFFAIQTVSQSTFIGVIVGMVWGMAIFILDSYIIASYKKNDRKWAEFKIVIPRLFLALVLGCSISIPLELKVFENEISVAINAMENEQEIANTNLANIRYQKDIEAYQLEKADLQADNNKLDTGLAPLRKRVTQLENDLTDEVAATGRTKRLGYGTVAKGIDGQLQSAKKEYNSQKLTDSPVMARNSKRIGQLDSLISTVKPQPVKKVNLYGISAQLDGLKRLTSKNNYVLLAYWIFFLLILGIETAPIFVKFFTPKGSYDEILAANEYVIYLEQQKRKSDLNELVNAEIEATRSVNERRKVAQDTVNKRLMDEIAKAQGEISEKAIRLWKFKQFVKIDENLDDFVKTDETNN